ncbi:MAG: hypothetical protein XFASWVDF_001383 [Candidatus Fervidibacter sp.]
MPLGRINGGLQGELPLSTHGRHKGLPLPFAIRYSLPFDQSPVAIRHSLPFDQSPVAIR